VACKGPDARSRRAVVHCDRPGPGFSANAIKMQSIEQHEMIVASALLLLYLIDPAAAATLTGRADIVDADTIKVGGIPVRLYGIDAPESRQSCERDGKPYGCGKQATKTLADLIAAQPVQCEIVGRDDFGLSP
jgi:endonuclease YncB( thermonuclease family)